MSELISGKEAFNAAMDGDDVEYKVRGDINWCDFNGESWSVNELKSSCIDYRIKPHTITLNGIEVPAPFEPKDGDEFYFLCSRVGKGYALVEKINSNCVVDQFGAWRTEDEIKQVIKALRSIFNAN